jgi:hypothetical protein
MPAMGLTCNIDARGKRARLINGLILLLGGLLLAIFWAMRTGELLAWIAVIACVAGGAFCVFEARAGWCALRAMGIKTKL